MNLGNATGHPSDRNDPFTNQVLAQLELFTKPEECTPCRSGMKRWRDCIWMRSVCT